MLPDVAVICVVPAPCPSATPFCAPIVATVAFDDDQATLDVISCVVPSLNLPIAVNCWVAFGAREAAPGETATDVNVALVTVSGTAGLTMPVCAEPDAVGPNTIGEPVVGANCEIAPAPWFNKMVTELSTWLTTARSWLPLPRRSAEANATGPWPTGNCWVAMVVVVTPPTLGVRP